MTAAAMTGPTPNSPVRLVPAARTATASFFLVDLDIPQEGWGVLDSCGVAHLLGDGDPQLAALRPDGPLLDAASLVLFGFHPAQLSPGQWRRFASHGLYGVPVSDMPPGTAGRRAIGALARLRNKRALVCHPH